MVWNKRSLFFDLLCKTTVCAVVWLLCKVILNMIASFEGRT
jgi:hypothetical protein